MPSDPIIDICGQLSVVAEHIGNLSGGIEAAEKSGDKELSASYEEMRFTELEHAQRLVLLLTGRIAGENQPHPESEEHQDENTGSAFAEGELTDNIGSEE